MKAYLLVILLGYLLGSSNMAFWLSKLKKVDIRSMGSGNLGASNAVTLMGWKAGVITALHDGAKAFLAVLLFRWIFPEVEAIGTVAGVAAVYGHIYPFYLKFKGGKGLASFFGMIIALNWKVAIAMGVILVLVTVITDFISLATMTVSVTAPIGIWIETGTWMIPLVLCVATVVILLKHRENVVRIMNHTEIGLRSTAKGENRVK